MVWELKLIDRALLYIFSKFKAGCGCDSYDTLGRLWDYFWGQNLICWTYWLQVNILGCQFRLICWMACHLITEIWFWKPLSTFSLYLFHCAGQFSVKPIQIQLQRQIGKERRHNCNSGLLTACMWLHSWRRSLLHLRLYSSIHFGYKQSCSTLQ